MCDNCIDLKEHGGRGVRVVGVGNHLKTGTLYGKPGFAGALFTEFPCLVLD